MKTFFLLQGMGGQLNYFGFWIDAEYGKGKCSPSCTTYTYRQLSAKTDFLIDSIEVWAVGPEPVKDEEEVNYNSSCYDSQYIKYVSYGLPL